ncbi:hypothetical protein N5C93_14290 [Pseudomonas nitroreducens]|uniref:hypothetical protein n=1 Tax=Pseudomonas nitroreducens TaxID=46680 RepID=UPI0014734E1A|nr:hypothetical protein [Pseudomonas nitroreducens]MCJ1877798.1 hypothetical protein [Pseudomonas nitroreducens]MCJ1897028.1 hypothetical protein [Pseudomonas nitroreducens]MDG9855154.1 hypothetical protein [Pseudomonas nitroreducens]MDH1074005.1 hypothetical protein [Pseudomonas nitroreducens]NMZ73921.1 hypothetical protein [Pseudomonas nitroreducens]
MGEPLPEFPADLARLAECSTRYMLGGPVLLASGLPPAVHVRPRRKGLAGHARCWLAARSKSICEVAKLRKQRLLSDQPR